MTHTLPLPANAYPIYTIGHSIHSAATFVKMLQDKGVRVLCDVRTSPRSHHNPQFNRDDLARALVSGGIDYVGLSELGGLSKLSVTTNLFKLKIGTVLAHAEEAPVAMMCSEKNPAECHRAGKLAAYLIRQPGPYHVEHIMSDGTTVDAVKFEPSIPKKLLWHEFGGIYGSPADSSVRADAPPPRIQGELL